MPRSAEPRAWPTKPTRIGVLFVYPCRGGGAAPAHDMRRPWGWSKVCLSPDSCASTINNALQSEVSRPGANCVCASSVVNDRPPCEHRYVFWGCIVRCLSGTHVHTVALPYRLLGTSEFCCLLASAATGPDRACLGPARTSARTPRVSPRSALAALRVCLARARAQPSTERKANAISTLHRTVLSRTISLHGAFKSRRIPWLAQSSVGRRPRGTCKYAFASPFVRHERSC